MTIIHPQTPARDVLTDHEMARVEAATVSTSLSAESARQVRIDRIIASAANPADKARAQGFYDFMLGRPSQAQGPRLEVSYAQGWAKGMQRRATLNGKAWYEVEKERAGGKWSWRIYREGFFQVDGTATSETRADQQIEDTKADLMDRYEDWRPRDFRCSAVESAHDDDDAAPRM